MSNKILQDLLTKTLLSSLAGNRTLLADSSQHSCSLYRLSIGNKLSFYQLKINSLFNDKTKLCTQINNVCEKNIQINYFVLRQKIHRVFVVCRCLRNSVLSIRPSEADDHVCVGWRFGVVASTVSSGCYRPDCCFSCS